MGVTLFTSRVVLHALGESNYGIYNVVGGIVIMFSFLNGSLGLSTSRYLTFSIGQNNSKLLDETFSAALNLHIVVALLVLILGETLGVWFLNTKMNIPFNQMYAANWLLQFSIITTCFGFTQAPYNATLISHEDMTVFAYIGLYEAFSKLGIAFLITLNNSDRLILYGFLLMVNAIIVQFFYKIYTRKNYKECKFRWVKNKKLYKDFLGFTGWDLYGNFGAVCQGQGMNILINIFFGPIINAARGIAIQIQSAVQQFLMNFLTAVRPRVVKFYAEGRYDKMYSLTFYGCKISYFLMLALILPVIFEINFILKIWLGDEVPPDTNIFAIIILATLLVDSWNKAFSMAYHAIGKIKTGSLIGGTILIIGLPIAWILLDHGFPAYTVFIINLLTSIITFIVGWILIYQLIAFNILNLFQVVIIPCLIVTALSVILPCIIVNYFPDNWMRFFLVIILSELAFFIFAYFIGFNKSEKMELFIPIFMQIKRKLHII